MVRLYTIGHSTRTIDDLIETLKGHGIQTNPEPEILWNFEKFIIDRTGKVTARFAPNTTPDDPALVSALEKELAKN